MPRSVLVTGAADGIGRGIALCFADLGDRVALLDYDGDKLERTAAELRANGRQVLAIQADVRDAAAVDAAVDSAVKAHAGLDVAINNAAVYPNTPVVDMSEGEWDSVLDTNLKGAWLMAREFAQHLADRQRPGRIVNIASVLGVRTIARVPSYTAAKAGLIHLTQVLAMELARYGILVNAIAPGYVETDFNREFFASAPGQALVKRIPQRRLGEARELDGALLLLASGASAYMTGSVIAVDGGHLVSGL